MICDSCREKDIKNLVIYQKGSSAVVIRNNKTMDLCVRPGSDTSERERVLSTWYRRRLDDIP